MYTPDSDSTLHATRWWPVLLGLALGSIAFAANPAPQLGQPLSAAELAMIPATVFPDGSGLPAGSGTPAMGNALFEQHCMRCHGQGGIGLTAPALAGAEEPLDSEYPDQTIGSFWPYAPVVFDFIHRAKPMDAPGTFTTSQVYALTAYLLVVNNVVDLADDSPLDAAALKSIAMPNRNGFRPIVVKP